MNGDRIVQQAREYIGVPFLHQGRSKRGVDCVGLVVRVAQDLGLSRYDFTEYGMDPNLSQFMRVLRACPDWERIPITDRQSGDVLVLALNVPCHVAIYTGSGVIHAMSLRGKVCEHRLTSDWKRKVRECYRFKGVE
jgi:cell wall-associated NlpC family hydrolase